MTKYKSATCLLLLILTATALSGLLFFNFNKKDLRINPLLSRCPNCNVIMISIDTLRPDHLSMFGYPRQTSPNLDAFAKNSIVFANTYTQATWTLPSHMSLFTSLYPETHGVTVRAFALSNKIKTLAEILKANGYQTGGFVAALDTSTNADPSDVAEQYGFGRGFDIYKDRLGKSFHDTLPPAQQWLNKNKGKKFFLFLHSYDVHAVYKHPGNFDHVFDKNYTGIIDFLINNRVDFSQSFIKNKQPRVSFNNKDYSLNRRDIEHIIAHYDGGILYADSLLGPFLKQFENATNTIIVITSDHGEKLDDPNPTFYQPEEPRNPSPVFGHGDVFENTSRVLFLLYYPGVPHKKINNVVQLIDVAPTLLDILGIPNNAQMQGSSLASTIYDRASSWLNIAYVSGYLDIIKAVRKDNWKLRIQDVSDISLFDIKIDPIEFKRIEDDYSSMVSVLRQLLDRHDLLSLAISSHNGYQPTLRDHFLKDNMGIQNIKKESYHNGFLYSGTSVKNNHNILYTIVTNIDKINYNNYLIDRVNSIKLSYITKSKCSTDLSLHTYASSSVQYYIDFLDNRMSKHTCIENEASYRNTIIFKYCEALDILIEADISMPVRMANDITQYRGVVLDCSFNNP